MGLSRPQFAEIVNVEPITLGRYERDEVNISEISKGKIESGLGWSPGTVDRLIDDDPPADFIVRHGSKHAIEEFASMLIGSPIKSAEPVADIRQHINDLEAAVANCEQLVQSLETARSAAKRLAKSLRGDLSRKSLSETEDYL
ncbi:hypothetical protein [Lysinibacter sp. HNR]|uniref:hypothetical protein n=1 Tax=Lysinibacter sp. HNR TaxID=3031408 RepID=UPI002435E6EB|nr:hypothetical protein [Lysinibacter sp. HNR]WGD37550.1 hypothetical protein FrondiHNR_01100 [Lysinibacter sp. HNR]